MHKSKFTRINIKERKIIWCLNWILCKNKTNSCRPHGKVRTIWIEGVVDDHPWHIFMLSTLTSVLKSNSYLIILFLSSLFWYVLYNSWNIIIVTTSLTATCSSGQHKCVLMDRVTVDCACCLISLFTDKLSNIQINHF